VSVDVVVGVAAAAAGAAGGALGPVVLRRLPEPRADAGEDPAEAARHPVKVAYAELARQPRLALHLALASALVCGLLGAGLGWMPALPAYLLAGVVGTWLAWVDLQLHLLPDRLNGPLFAGCLALLVLAAASGDDWASLRGAVAGAFALLGFYLLLALVRPADMGLGDVKLAGVLGLLLGWLGWGPLAVGAVAAFLLGGLAGLALVAARRGGLRTALPFGPFMLAGALLGVLVGEPVAAAYVGSF
jgi:leader peptidase (prepilin peptidase) / N-methyltransferase